MGRLAVFIASFDRGFGRSKPGEAALRPGKRNDSQRIIEMPGHGVILSFILRIGNLYFYMCKTDASHFMRKSAIFALPIYCKMQKEF
jgi:hypothetical protein